MLQSLKNQKKAQEIVFMGILSSMCFGLFMFRFLYVGFPLFIFLNWNLFLAFIPWVLTTLLILRPKLQDFRFFTTGVILVWLLFFPNAPYILTDLFHLGPKVGIPVWFDLVMILAFAWTGLLFGFLSLWDLEKIYKNIIPVIWIRLLSVGLLFLGSFGIYLGRYLRWNSWDIIQHPFGLIKDIAVRFLNPFEHPSTWGMTIFMGLLLNMIYWSFRIMMRREI